MAELSNRRKTTALLALLLAAVVLAIGAISAQRKVASFQPIGFTAKPATGHWLVTSVAGSTAADTGLEAGDQILLVNGEGAGSIGGQGDLGRVLRQRPTAELEVVRGETLQTVAYRLPPLDVDFSYLILALIGCGYVFIGFYTLTRHRERPALLFYLWCLASTAVYLIAAEPPFDDGAAKFAYVVEAVARILLAPLTLHLFSIFPRRDASHSRLRRWIPFYYLPAAFLLLLQLDLIQFNGRLLLGGRLATAVPVLDRFELYHLVLFSLAAAAVLGWRLYRPRDHEPHRQATWIAVGMAAGFLPFIFLYLLPRELGSTLPQVVTAGAVLPLALVPLTFAYAILRYRLWDIGIVVRDTLSLGLTIVIGAIGFSLANLVVSRIVPENLELGRNLLVFASGVSIAGLMIPTRRSLSESLERVQYRGAYSRRRALTDFGREIIGETDLERLSSRLAAELQASLGIPLTTVLSLRGHSLHPAHRSSRETAELTSGDGVLEPFLSAEEFSGDFWDAEVNSFAVVDFPASNLSTAHKLHAAGYRYGFPLKVRAHSLGMVVTSYKGDGIPLSSDDVDLLRGLFNQVALAIENAQLLGQVQRQLEEVSRLQRFTEQIIESSPAGIAVVDGDAQIVSANAALGLLLETRPEDLSGKKLHDYLPSEPLPRPGEGLREISLSAHDGSERYLQLSAAPLPAPDSKGHRVIVVQDVTDRVAMENALKEKDRLASLGMLAAGVAHEVNTPITGISSYAQMLLAETPSDDPRHKLLKKVESQTFRAANIVNGLLDFARNRGGEHTTLDLGPMVDESLDLLRERLHQQHVGLEWQVPGDKIEVVGNTIELQQVVTNLTLNAIDAMSETENAKLTVAAGSSRPRGAGTAMAWITIEDNGPGIPPADLDKIFQPFYSTKLSSGGTGLGLSISYNIIRRHHGTIRVVSQPGEGCRFIVELPLAVEGSAESKT